MKIKNIITGWINRFKSHRKEFTEIFNDRLEVCQSNECRKLRLGVCMACGCPVKSKTKVLSETCPENMWEPSVYEQDGRQFILLADTHPWLYGKFYETNPNYSSFPEGSVSIDVWESFLDSVS